MADTEVLDVPMEFGLELMAVIRPDFTDAERELFNDVVGEVDGVGVIPPFLMGLSCRIHAAVFSFIAGVMPPMPMLGRSLL